jgi:Rnl2 family RNA ligase
MTNIFAEGVFVFKKYSEIENTYREKAVDQVFLQQLSDGDWIVTEKIHGSNVTFYTDGHDIRVAKRTSFLETEEELLKFYNMPEIVKRYRQYIIKTFEVLKEDNKEVKYVRIHGEVFGGSYPHKQVKADPVSLEMQTFPLEM